MQVNRGPSTQRNRSDNFEESEEELSEESEKEEDEIQQDKFMSRKCLKKDIKTEEMHNDIPKWHA